ncbi:MAG: ribose-phosphate diphosphokinase [Promethearchaeota archaeon]
MAIVIIGKSNFAGKIAKSVSKSVFIEIEEKIFPDNEVCPRLLLSSGNQLKRSHVIIIMQLKSNQPKNQYLISLLWTIYNVKQYNPERISCIMPYHLYSRQDRASRIGEPISSQYLALALESAGINDFVTFNSHTYGKVDISQFFLSSRASDLSAIPILGTKLKACLSNPEETICLAPDEGALFLAKEIAKTLNSSFFAAIQKYRDPETGEISQKLVGLPFEIKDRSIVIIDDMVSSGKTMVGAAKIVKDKGAKEIIFAYIHAVHSPTSFLTMQEVNPSLIITTDTIKTGISGLTEMSVIPLISSWIQKNS